MGAACQLIAIAVLLCCFNFLLVSIEVQLRRIADAMEDTAPDEDDEDPE